MPLEIFDGVFGMDHPLMENSECAGRKLSTHDPVYHLRWSRGLDGIKKPGDCPRVFYHYKPEKNLTVPIRSGTLRMKFQG